MSTRKIELSVGAIKYIDPNEMITEEEFEYIRNKIPELDERVGVVEDEIEDKIPELDERVGVVEDEIEEINSSLDNKASKNEVFSMANMGQDIKEAMTGGSVAVVEGNSIDFCNFAYSIQNELGEWKNIDIEEWEESLHYRGEIGEIAVKNTTAELYHSTTVIAKNGEHFKVSLRTQSINQTGIMFVDADMKIIGKKLTSDGQLVEYTDYEFTVPKGTTKVIFCTYQNFGNISNFKLKKLVSNGFSNKSVLEGRINNLEATSTKISDVLISYENQTFTKIPNTFWSTENEIVELKDYVGDYSSIEIDCNHNDKFLLNLWIGSSIKQNGIVITDADYKPIYKHERPTAVMEIKDLTLVIPENGRKLLINVHGYKGETIKKAILKEMATKDYVDLKTINNISNKFNGKKLAIIGDSISSYIGWVPSTNKVYYTGSNSGVSNVNEMWWKRVADTLGMEVIQVEAWSGSKVSNINAESSGFIPMSDVSRCQNLHKDGIEPDVLIIFAGTNDYSKSNAKLGNYPLNGDAPTNNDSFSEGYALMLSRIQERYPNIEIYCCSLPVFVRTNQDKKGIEWNSENKTINDYNEVVRKVANLYSCKYIDLQGCGITRQNAYPTYCVDYTNTPTHPNAEGHKKYAERIIEQL